MQLKEQQKEEVVLDERGRKRERRAAVDGREHPRANCH